MDISRDEAFVIYVLNALSAGPYLKKAFRKNVPIKMFEKPQGAAKRRAEKAAQVSQSDIANTIRLL